MESKPFYKSKTFWFNVVAVLVLILGQFGYEGVISPEYQGYVDAFVPAIIAIVNLGLRLITKQPVSIR
jgi:hypothetical protein